MSTFLITLGAVVLAYWGYSMSKPQFSRPIIILKNGGMVFVIGAVLLTAGLLA